MSIIHGSRGLIYFVHQFKPKFDDRSLLRDRLLLAGVTQINEEVRRLAPVIHQEDVEGLVEVSSANMRVPIAIRVRCVDKQLYVFAVSMSAGKREATFHVPTPVRGRNVERIGEAGSISLEARRFGDSFSDYRVRLYRMRLR